MKPVARSASDPTASQRIDWNWLDRVTAVGEDDIVAHRDILASEWFFQFHFPGLPIVPGVLLIEAMAHAAGTLAVLRAYSRTSRLHHYLLAGVDGARFYRRAVPGDRVTIHARLQSGETEDVVVRATAKVEAARIARCDVLLHELDASLVTGDLDALLLRSLERVLAPDLRERHVSMFSADTRAAGGHAR